MNLPAFEAAQERSNETKKCFSNLLKDGLPHPPWATVSEAKVFKLDNTTFDSIINTNVEVADFDKIILPFPNMFIEIDTDIKSPIFVGRGVSISRFVIPTYFPCTVIYLWPMDKLADVVDVDLEGEYISFSLDERSAIMANCRTCPNYKSIGWLQPDPGKGASQSVHNCRVKQKHLREDAVTVCSHVVKMDTIVYAVYSLLHFLSTIKTEKLYTEYSGTDTTRSGRVINVRLPQPYYDLKLASRHIKKYLGSREGSPHSYRYDVRAHLRHMATGEIVTVKSHMRGPETAPYIPRTYVFGGAVSRVYREVSQGTSSVMAHIKKFVRSVMDQGLRLISKVKYRRVAIKEGLRPAR